MLILRTLFYSYSRNYPPPFSQTPPLPPRPRSVALHPRGRQERGGPLRPRPKGGREDTGGAQEDRRRRKWDQQGGAAAGGRGQLQVQVRGDRGGGGTSKTKQHSVLY